jgi:hypothetical protein
LSMCLFGSVVYFMYELGEAWEKYFKQVG